MSPEKRRRGRDDEMLWWPLIFSFSRRKNSEGRWWGERKRRQLIYTKQALHLKTQQHSSNISFFFQPRACIQFRCSPSSPPSHIRSLTPCFIFFRGGGVLACCLFNTFPPSLSPSSSSLRALICMFVQNFLWPSLITSFEEKEGERSPILPPTF